MKLLMPSIAVTLLGLLGLLIPLKVSAEDPIDMTCPDRVYPVPEYTVGLLQPLTWFKCPGDYNNMSLPSTFYSTQYSAEYPTSDDLWARNCTDSYVWSDGDSLARKFTSFCCPSGQVATWRIWTTGNNGWFGRITAVCNDVNNTTLDPITYGWNDTTTCESNLTNSIDKTDPNYNSSTGGQYTMRAIADTLQFLEVGARESNIRLFQCPVGLVPIGFGARSTCRSLKDFKVLCAALDNSTTGLAPGVNRNRNSCTNGLKPATDPIGEPGPWLGETNDEYNISRTNPYYSNKASEPLFDCCNVGRIEKWHLVFAGDDRSADTALGHLAATCSDGSVLASITFGYNGTDIDCKRIRPALIRGGVTIPTPADGKFYYKTFDSDGVPCLVSNFLITPNGNSSEEGKVFQCPDGTQPLGYSAASSCLGLTQLQVLCGIPIDSVPAPASAPSPNSDST